MSTSTLPQKQANATGTDDWISQNMEEAKVEAIAPKPSNGVFVGPDHVLIYDTTLRDGTQGESISVSVDDKLKISRRLAAFGVDHIECGWPGSNPKDAEFFERAKTELDGDARSRLVAFGSTRRKNRAASEDPQIGALLESGAPTLCLVAKAHPWQVMEILRVSKEENLAMIADSVRYLTEDHGRRVMIDLEHFFDGYREDPEYVTDCAGAAVSAGAAALVLCDTNGAAMPWEVEAATASIRKAFPDVTVGIHAHNDRAMAVANSLSAVRAGAGLVQGTVNGVGERTGNADLCSIVPTLALGSLGSTTTKTTLTCRDRLPQITALSRYVDELLNRVPNPSAPYVGVSAFAHKGGLHVAAMARSPLSYQHIDPQDVGNEQRTLISELSGRQNILGKMEEMGLMEDHNEAEASEKAIAILNRVKALEAKGYSFEGADASVRLMILHSSDDYCAPFKVLDYSTQVSDANLNWEKKRSDGLADNMCPTTCRATIQVRSIQDDEGGHKVVDRLEVSDGNGPVDALGKAMMRALTPSHEELRQVTVVDYKVRILDPESATEAATRVMIEFRDAAREESWTTVSVHTNVITASLHALMDGLEYALLSANDKKMCLLWEDA